MSNFEQQINACKLSINKIFLLLLNTACGRTCIEIPQIYDDSIRLPLQTLQNHIFQKTNYGIIFMISDTAEDLLKNLK